MEGVPKLPSNEKAPNKETPARFRLAIEAMLKANFSSIEVYGEENLAELPPDAKIIFATTHISDFDVVMPIAKLGERFKMKAVNASLQHDIKEDTFSNIGLRVAGIENTIPVDIKWGEHSKAGKAYYSQRFNPDNFVPMKDALDEGNAVAIAAYTPSPVKDGTLPDRGGNGAVYLAEISDAIIVPVAVHIKSEDPGMGMRMNPSKSLLKRPEAEMHIGKPIILEKIEGVDNFNTLIQSREPADVEERKRITKGLRERSDAVMQSLAELLPQERRGRWDLKRID